MPQALEDLGVTGFGILVIIAFNLLVNSVLLWLVVNYMMDFGEKIPFKRCLLVVPLLIVVLFVAVFAGAFLPGFFQLIAMVLIFYFGSRMVIEGVFDVTEGSFRILVLFALTNGLVFYLLSKIE